MNIAVSQTFVSTRSNGALKSAYFGQKRCASCIKPEPPPVTALAALTQGLEALIRNTDSHEQAVAYTKCIDALNNASAPASVAFISMLEQVHANASDSIQKKYAPDIEKLKAGVTMRRSPMEIALGITLDLLTEDYNQRCKRQENRDYGTIKLLQNLTRLVEKATAEHRGQPRWAITA